MNAPPSDWKPGANTRSGKLLRLDVAGQRPGLWIKLKPVLIARVQALLNSIINDERGTTVREELKDLTAGLLDYAKAKLETPAAELEKTYAEVAKLYAERRREIAQAEKSDAEAAAIRLESQIKELRLALGMTKAMLVGEAGEEAILFGKQVDTMLVTLREIASAPA